MTQASAAAFERQRLAWLETRSARRMSGRQHFRDLINRFGSAEAAIEELPGLMRNARRPPQRRASRPMSAAEAEMENAECASARVSSASASPTIRRNRGAWTIRRR